LLSRRQKILRKKEKDERALVVEPDEDPMELKKYE
jgi:hypothetical protein